MHDGELDKNATWVDFQQFKINQGPKDQVLSKTPDDVPPMLPGQKVIINGRVEVVEYKASGAFIFGDVVCKCRG